MPDNNSLLQSSNTDLIGVSDAEIKIYDGSEYIEVDNNRDKISLKPGAITKINSSNTISEQHTTNNKGEIEYTLSLEPENISKIKSTDSILQSHYIDTEGNIVYELDVDASVSNRYTGNFPIQVDNTNNTIGLNNVELNVQYPLQMTVDDTTATFEILSGDYYYYNNIFATIEINPTSTTFIVSDIFSVNPGETIEGVLYITGLVLPQGSSTSYGKIDLVAGSNTIVAKERVNFDWSNLQTAENVIHFYYKNTTSNNVSLNLVYDTGVNQASTSTLVIRFNGKRV